MSHQPALQITLPSSHWPPFLTLASHWLTGIKNFKKKQNQQTAAAPDEINPAFYKPRMFLFIPIISIQSSPSNPEPYKFTHQIFCLGRNSVKTLLVLTWRSDSLLMIWMYRCWECMKVICKECSPPPPRVTRPVIRMFCALSLLTNQRHHLFDQSEGNVITRHHLITDISDIWADH